MQVSDKLRKWLETSDRPVGSVVHTCEGKKAIRAEHTPSGWVFEEEEWQYTR